MNIKYLWLVADKNIWFDSITLKNGRAVINFLFSGPNIIWVSQFILPKETTLERADFTLQLLMFVTAEKEGQMFTIFFHPIFVSCCPRGFKQG